MLVDLTKILTDTGQSFIKDIQRNLDSTGTTATGKTKRSLRQEITKDGNKIILTIYGREFFFTVETGRKATPDKKPSSGMIANIRQWVQARGMNQSMVWAIAMSIQKKGTLLHQRGGREDIVSNVLDQSKLSSIAKSILEQFAITYLSSFKSTINANRT